MTAKIASTVVISLLAFGAMCGEMWTLDKSAKIPGNFWTITSPDKKWKLACVPSRNMDINLDSPGDADLVICSKYWYCPEWEWNEFETEDVFNKEVDCVLSGSGVLTLPVKARDSQGIEYTIELADWSMEGWYKNGGAKITKCIIPAEYTSYFGEGTSLASFEVETGNPKYYSADGVLYLKSSARNDGGSGNILMQFPTGKTGKFAIPNGVTAVRRGAFERASISELVIGSDLKVFESDSEVLNNLKTVTVKDNDRFVYANGFLMGDYGRTVVLSLHGVLAGLTDIYVPASVTKVDEYAMAYFGGNSLKNIIFTSSRLDLCQNALHDCVIPKACIDFGAVTALALDPEALSETTAKSVVLPENTVFGLHEYDFGYLELGETGIKDIYWYTDKSYEESGLYSISTWEGRVRLHVLRTAGDWSGFDCDGVSVVKDLVRTSLMTVVPSNAEGGKVVGGGRYSQGQNVTLKATANNGYVFSHWEGPLGDTTDPHSPSVTYVVGEEDAQFVAYFVPASDAGSESVIPSDASVYNGILSQYENIAGTIQAKVAKPKKGVAKVTVSIEVLGSKKVTVKGEMDTTTGIFTGTTKDGKIFSFTFDMNGVNGDFAGLDVVGCRDLFSSKDKAEKAEAEAMFEPYLGAYAMICEDGTFSVTLAKKGKVTIKGTVDGAKVSAKAQALIGEDKICIPVVYSKKSVNLAFTIWLPFDGGEAEVVGLEGAVFGKAGTLGEGARFMIDGDIGEAIETEDARTLELLPNDEEVTVSGTKWLVADGVKAAKVAYKNGELTITEGKKGAGIVNPSGLKLTYKAKDGTFKGSFTAYAIVKGKLKKHKATVEGVLINGIGYGTATIKKLGSWPIVISSGL